jgi:hypothetical protein
MSIVQPDHRVAISRSESVEHCKYKHPRHVRECKEPAWEGSEQGFCILHDPDPNKPRGAFETAIRCKKELADYSFDGCIFPRGFSGFEGVTFRWDASFRDVTFLGDARFLGARFERGVWFDGATFYGDVWFLDVTFDWLETSFVGAVFKGTAGFARSTFRAVSFDETTFLGSVLFPRATFRGTASFRNARFHRAAQLNRARFLQELDLVGSTFDWPNAGADACRVAKARAQEAGDYEGAGEYYLRERRYIRSSKSPRDPRRWLEYFFFDLSCGYGERPLRVIGIAVAFIVFCGLLYWISGGVSPSSADVAPAGTPGFLDYLYFSVVTFTTVGYGDWHPEAASWARYVAMIEAFSGAFMIALFVLTFGRRMMR